MKQTAVEWLEEQIIRFHNWKLNPVYDENCFNAMKLDKSIKQAKEMEKQQIIDFAYEIADDLAYGVLSKKAIEDLFNETYKSE